MTKPLTFQPEPHNTYWIGPGKRVETKLQKVLSSKEKIDIAIVDIATPNSRHFTHSL